MDAAFATIDRGLADLAGVDLALLTPEEIGRGILTMQSHMDRTRVIQARWMAEGDQRGLFTASGHATARRGWPRKARRPKAQPTSRPGWVRH
jgi:hypothetical protein